MKKIILTVLCAVLLLSFMGCKSDTTDTAETENTIKTTVLQEDLILDDSNADESENNVENTYDNTSENSATKAYEDYSADADSTFAPDDAPDADPDAPVSNTVIPDEDYSLPQSWTFDENGQALVPDYDPFDYIDQ